MGIAAMLFKNATAAAAGFDATILADSPVRYWKLGESAGASTAIDATGNANGTYNSVTTGATGFTSDLAKATTFSGSSSTMTLTSAAPVGASNEMSFECFFKWNASAQDFQCLVQNGTNAARGYQITMSGGAMQVNVAGLGPFNSAFSPTVGTWYHLVFTYNHATLILYINGVSVFSQASTGTIQSPAAFYTLCGYQASGTGAFCFNGTLQKVASYNYALTSAQVAAHYAAR